MYGMRGLALVSLLALAACGGGGSGVTTGGGSVDNGAGAGNGGNTGNSGGNTDNGSGTDTGGDNTGGTPTPTPTPVTLGFEGTDPAALRRATITRTATGADGVTTYNAPYDPTAGTLDLIDYTGAYVEGEWQTDTDGNRLLVINPANTRFVRQIEAEIVGETDSAWHHGVVGFASPNQPRTGNALYHGTSSGTVALADAPGVETPYNGESRVFINLGNASGNYVIHSVTAANDGETVPFTDLAGQFVVRDGNRLVQNIAELSATITMADGRSYRGVFHGINGGIFGPNAEEVGAGYQFGNGDMRINGAFVAQR
ncbi:hypothetical protein [Ketogulonicigenium vulgare]|nr:hypothetical protein [Ketogulonicigenium vulgare]ADO44045.1 hypothetical protein EIO_2977 [Ketogulonicigenium vulgare Y25]ALJ82602.1 hypothetical protein KVH_14990 [Ketogulonicigenium vulgare]ANW35359.1 hypothetical protein KvSKV_14880 [Ketogulonicigenium vulgare]